MQSKFEVVGMSREDPGDGARGSGAEDSEGGPSCMAGRQQRSVYLLYSDLAPRAREPNLIYTLPSSRLSLSALSYLCILDQRFRPIPHTARGRFMSCQ